MSELHEKIGFIDAMLKFLAIAVDEDDPKGQIKIRIQDLRNDSKKALELSAMAKLNEGRIFR